MIKKFTQKGWLGLCPVYLADIDGEIPAVMVRRAWLNPLLRLSEFVFWLVRTAGSVFKPDFMEWTPLFVTGDLETPTYRTFEG